MNDLDRGAHEYMQHVQFEGVPWRDMRESNRMLPSKEGNHNSPQRHKYSEMVGTHHHVGARGIIAGRFWAVRGGETTSRHATWMRARGGIPSHGAFVFLFLKACLGFSPSLRACSRQEHPGSPWIGAALGPQRPRIQRSRKTLPKCATTPH